MRIFKTCILSVLLLGSSFGVSYAEIAPRPTKEGKVWADSKIEGLVEYYTCMRASELYDLDWVVDTPEYRAARSEEECSAVAYTYFLREKLLFQRENVGKIRRWNTTYLQVGTSTILAAWASWNYGWPIISLMGREGVGRTMGNLCEELSKEENKWKPWDAVGAVSRRGRRHNIREHTIERTREVDERGGAREETVTREEADDYGIPLTSFLWAWTAGLGVVPDLSLPLLIKRWGGAHYYGMLKGPMEDDYMKLEEMYVRHYHPMKAANPQLLNELKVNMVDLREGFGRDLYFYSDLMHVASKLPLRRGRFNFDAHKFQERYKFYPKHIKKVLAQIMGRMCFFGANNEDVTTNFPLYFQGIPGSGKTYAVNNITEVTGAPVCHITLDGGTIEEIIGTKYGKPGRLLTALTKGAKDGRTNFSNGVLFIDEFDRLLSDSQHDPMAKALLSFMLKMLDPGNRRFFSPYLNCFIELPSTIVLAGNYEIKDAALANRFQIVKFDGYDEELKWGIAREYLVPKVAKIYGFREAEEEDLEAVYEIVQEDVGDDGIRSVELKIIKYFEEKRMDQYLGDLDA